MVWDANRAKMLIALAFPRGHPRFGTFCEADLEDGQGPEWPNKGQVGGSELTVLLEYADQPVGDDPRELWFHTDPNAENVRLVFRVDCREMDSAHVWMFAEIKEGSPESARSGSRSLSGWTFSSKFSKDGSIERSVDGSL